MVNVIWLITTYDKKLKVDVVNNLDFANDLDFKEEIDYIEKIDNFYLKEFDKNQKLLNTINVKNYFIFKNKSSLMIEILLTVYNKQTQLIYTISAKRANYLENGEIKFTGDININYMDGQSYMVTTDELIFNTKNNHLISNKKVVYSSDNIVVTSKGLQITTNKDKIQLMGDVVMDNLGNDRINTKNLTINTLQKTYVTEEKTHYQSKITNIYANSMHYNAEKRQIKLSGGVKAYYE